MLRRFWAKVELVNEFSYFGNGIAIKFWDEDKRKSDYACLIESKDLKVEEGDVVEIIQAEGLACRGYNAVVIGVKDRLTQHMENVIEHHKNMVFCSDLSPKTLELIRANQLVIEALEEKLYNHIRFSRDGGKEQGDIKIKELKQEDGKKYSAIIDPDYGVIVADSESGEVVNSIE